MKSEKLVLNHHAVLQDGSISAYKAENVGGETVTNSSDQHLHSTNVEVDL